MNLRRGLSLPPLVGAIILVGGFGSFGSAHAQAIPKWAQENTDKWYAAYNAGDTAAIMSLYADDAVMLLMDLTIKGHAAIEAFHKRTFNALRLSCTWTIDAVGAADKLAVVWGSDSCVAMRKAGDAALILNGRWLTVYQQQPDGSWMIVRDSGEETRPPVVGRAIVN